MIIALAGYKKEARLSQGVTNDEDTELINFLNKKGLNIVSTIWNDPDTDWSGFEVVVIKSPWDYHNHLDEFLNWLDHLEKLGGESIKPC